MQTRIRLSVALASFACLIAFPGQTLAQPQPAQIDRYQGKPTGPITVQLQAIEMGQLVTLLLRDVMRVPYAISPEVVKDKRPTSVSLAIPRDDIPRTVVRFLRAVGYRVELVGGAVHVSRGDFAPSPSDVRRASEQFNQASDAPATTPSEILPSGNPLIPGSRQAEQAPIGRNNVSRSPQYSESPRLGQGDAPGVRRSYPDEQFLALVTPAYRDPGELADLIETMFPDLVIAYREGSAPKGGVAVSGRLSPDRLGLRGDEPMVRRAIAVMRELDRPRPLVHLSGAIVEVRDVQTRSSALSVLANLVGDTIGIGSLAGEGSGDSFLSLEVAGVRAVLSAVRGDSRFRVVAEPSLAALSGSTAYLNSGAQVPVLGAVSFTEDGDRFRSVEYRDSGLTLRVTPTVRPGHVELVVDQERSTFVRTTTGVNESPTLNRNTAQAMVTVQPGGVVALAGLKERSEGNSKRGLFGGLLGAKSREKTESELIVLLEVDLTRDQEQREMIVQEFPPIGPGLLRGGSPLTPSTEAETLEGAETGQGSEARPPLSLAPTPSPNGAQIAPFRYLSNSHAFLSPFSAEAPPPAA